MTPDPPAEDDPTGEQDGTEPPSEQWGDALGEADALESDDELGPEDDGPPAAFPMPGLSGALSRGVVGGLGQSQVILEPKNSTPFDVAEGGHGVPSSALWAMKYLRHGRYGLASGDGPDRIRWASDEAGPAHGAGQDGRDAEAAEAAEAGEPIGAGEADDDGADPGRPVYVIDDGLDHCMVARLVGASPDGCTYCLVARIKRPDFDDVRAGWAPATELFVHGKEFTLCGVVEGSVSNVVRVSGYRRYKHVPVEYLPPSPFIEFDQAI